MKSNSPFPVQCGLVTKQELEEERRVLESLPELEDRGTRDLSGTPGWPLAIIQTEACSR